MGFMDVLTRILQGKPAEDVLPDEVIPNDGSDGLEGEPGQQPQPAVEVQQPPQPPPVIQIMRTICNPKDSNMEVYGFLHNNSDITVQVDKIRLLGGMRVLGVYLKPGEQKEVLLYHGPTLHNTYNH